MEKKCCTPLSFFGTRKRVPVATNVVVVVVVVAVVVVCWLVVVIGFSKY